MMLFIFRTGSSTSTLFCHDPHHSYPYPTFQGFEKQVKPHKLTVLAIESQPEMHGYRLARINCKNIWVWKDASLSCLTHMTLKPVMREQEKSLLPVMQKCSLSCGKRNTKAPRNLPCLAAYSSVPTIHELSSQIFRPRHFCI